MAKLKIKGVNELMIVDNEEAKAIRVMKQNKVDGDQMVNAGNISVALKEVVLIVLDNEFTSDNRFANERDDDERKRIESVLSSPEEKANKNLGYFGFMFFCKHARKPDDRENKLAYNIALKFFNTEDGKMRMWAKPDIWFKGFSDERFKVQGQYSNWGFKLVEKIERNELEQVSIKQQEEQSLLASIPA